MRGGHSVIPTDIHLPNQIFPAQLSPLICDGGGCANDNYDTGFITT